jgi:hypothetical protein
MELFVVIQELYACLQLVGRGILGVVSVVHVCDVIPRALDRIRRLSCGCRSWTRDGIQDPISVALDRDVFFRALDHRSRLTCECKSVLFSSASTHILFSDGVIRYIRLLVPFILLIFPALILLVLAFLILINLFTISLILS